MLLLLAATTFLVLGAPRGASSAAWEGAGKALPGFAADTPVENATPGPDYQQAAPSGRDTKRIRLLYAQGWIRQYQCFNATTLKACFGWGGDVETRMITDARVFFEANVAELPNQFPNSWEEMARYDVVAINQFGYAWVYHGLRGDRYVPYRLTETQQALLKKYVEGGGGLIWIGGLEEEYRKGPLSEVLPVEVRSVREGDGTAREGLALVCDDPKHPVMVGIPWETFTFPQVAVEASPKPDASVLLRGQDGRPLIVVREAGTGKVLFFAPPWGKGNACDLGYRWRYAGQFWSQAVHWLAGATLSPAVESVTVNYPRVDPAMIGVRLHLKGLGPRFRGRVLLRLLDARNSVLAAHHSPLTTHSVSPRYALPIPAGRLGDERYYLRVELLDGRGRLVHRAELPVDVVRSVSVRVSTPLQHYRRGQKVTVYLQWLNHTAGPLLHLMTVVTIRDAHGQVLWTCADKADLPPEEEVSRHHEVESGAWACGDYRLTTQLRSGDGRLLAESQPWNLVIIPARFPGEDFTSFVVSLVTNIKRDVFSQKYLVRLLKSLRVNCSEQVWYPGQPPPVDYFEAAAAEGMACSFHAAVDVPIARQAMVKRDGQPAPGRFCFNACLSDAAWREAMEKALAEKCRLAERLIPTLSDLQGFPMDEPNWGGPDFCYCPACTELFQAEYGMAPPKSEAETPAWIQWHRFRNRSLGCWEQFYAALLKKHRPGAIFDPSNCLLGHPFVGNFVFGAGYLRDFSPCADAGGTWGFVHSSEFPLLHAGSYLAHLRAMLRPRGGGPITLGHYMGPPWLGDLSLNRLRKQSYLALGCGVKGVSYYPLDEFLWLRPYLDELRRLNSLYEKYGPLFVRVRPIKPRAAVLYSFTDLTARTPGDITAWATTAGYMALVQAGYPADMVYEEDVLEDLIEQYEVLFLFDVRQLPEEVVAKLARHIRQGKMVCVDSETKVNVPGATALGASLAEVRKDPQATGLGVFVLTDRTASPAYERLLVRLEQVCATHGLERPVVTDSRAVVPFCLTSGSGRYVVLVNKDNDTRHRVTVHVNGGYQLRHVFDLLSGEPIPCESLPPGTRFTTEVAPGDGKYLVALPDAPGEVSVSSERKRYQPGDKVELRLAVRGRTGTPIAAALPLQVKVYGPRGDERPEYGGYRSTEEGLCVETFELGVNDPQGSWTVWVKDLLTGQRARASFTVGAGPGTRAELKPARPPHQPGVEVALATDLQVVGPAFPPGLAAKTLPIIKRTLDEEGTSEITFDLAEKITDRVGTRLAEQQHEGGLLVIPLRIRSLRKQRPYLLVFNPMPYTPNSDSVFLCGKGKSVEVWDLFSGERLDVDSRGGARVFSPLLEPEEARIFELRPTHLPREEGEGR